MYAVVEQSSGHLFSLSTAPVTDVKAGYTVTDVGAVNLDISMWDEVSRNFVPRPAKVVRDYIADIQAQVEWATIPANRHSAVRDMLIRVLAPVRYY